MPFGSARKRVLFASPLLVSVQFGDVRCCAFIIEHVAAHAHRSARIGHVHHGAVVVRRNLNCRVHAARRGAADQQRDLAQSKIVVTLHFSGDVLHLLQTRRDQP